MTTAKVLKTQSGQGQARLDHGELLMPQLPKDKPSGKTRFRGGIAVATINSLS